MLSAAPGDVKTEVFDLDLKTRSGRTLPVRLFHKVAFGADGIAGASRTLVLNRARDDGTNLAGLPKSLYEKIYCARGQAENLIKAHKLHLASDRTSCTKATANQFRLLIHTTAYWLLLTLRRLAPRTSFWRDAQFDTIRLCLIKVAGRVTEMITRIKIALPTAYPYQAGFAMLAARVAKLPP